MPIIHNIKTARARTTTSRYGAKWLDFQHWHIEWNLDPLSCAVSSVLYFLKCLMARRLVCDYMKMYAAAISFCHKGGKTIFGDRPIFSHPPGQALPLGGWEIIPSDKCLLTTMGAVVVTRGLGLWLLRAFGVCLYRLLALTSAKRVSYLITL